MYKHGVDDGNITSVVTSLLTFFEVSITERVVKEVLVSHPNYPSLLSVSDSLIKWGISNEAYRLEPEQLTIDLFPVVVQLRTDSDKFMLVKSCSDTYFIYDDENGRDQMIDKIKFFEIWSGIVLISTFDVSIDEKYYYISKIKDFITYFGFLPLLFVLLILLAVFLIQYPGVTPLYFYPMLIIKIMGLWISVILLVQGLNTNYFFAKTLCGLSSKWSCDAILKSSASRITSWLSWSEMGFFYFSFTIILLLINNYIDDLGIKALIGLMSFVCLPYIVYSIYYQVIVVKEYCVLCCMVQVLLFCEGTLTSIFISLKDIYSFRIAHHFWVYLSAPLPVLLWSFGKKYFRAAVELSDTRQQLYHFKYNSALFQSVLKTQNHYKVTEDIFPIKLGNLNAETVVTIVGNPFCEPCAKAHFILDEWILSRNDICIEIIFFGAIDSNEDIEIIGHLLSLSVNSNQKHVREVLNSWYQLKNKKYNNWAYKYDSMVGDIKISEIIKKQLEWCSTANISFTPTILINGYQLPEPYSAEDIPYLI